jgi:hypothetical protein
MVIIFSIAWHYRNGAQSKSAGTTGMIPPGTTATVTTIYISWHYRDDGHILGHVVLKR